MFRKHLAAALAALLVAGACVRAQSGRHFPQSAVEREFIALTDGEHEAAPRKAAAGEARTRRVKDESFDPRGLNAKSTAPVVFAEDGGGCKSTKCRVGVTALFVYLVVAMAVGAANG